MARMLARADALGHTDPNHYLWCACRWHRFDPTKPAKSWDNAWRSLRKAAGLPGLRFYDLRHTFITEMAEAGVPEETMKAIAGHITKRMLEHYSHVCMMAKRRALDAVDQQREQERTATKQDDKDHTGRTQ